MPPLKWEDALRRVALSAGEVMPRAQRGRVTARHICNKLYKRSDKYDIVPTRC